MSVKQKKVSVQFYGQQHLGLVDGQSNGKDSSSSSRRLDQQALLLLITGTSTLLGNTAYSENQIEWMSRLSRVSADAAK